MKAVKNIFKQKPFSFIMFFAGIFGLLGVYILEIFFGFTPCDLCIKQRIVTGFLILASSFTLFLLKGKRVIIGDVLITIVILIMFGFAIYQLGVEKHLIELPHGCANINFEQDINKLHDAIMNINTLRPSCDIPQYLFGVSVASWTVMGTMFLVLIAAINWFAKFKK